MKRVTGGRWRRILLGHLLAEFVVGVEEVGTALVRVSGYMRSAGEFIWRFSRLSSSYDYVWTMMHADVCAHIYIRRERDSCHSLK